MKWSENTIAGALTRQFFERKHLVLVPNCSWPGSECDLLVVTRDLRVIDVEIKISRSDLKADAKKEKWFHSWDWKVDGPWADERREKRRARAWPHKVWKHYYALPADIWKPELLQCLPSQNSGVLLLSEQKGGTGQLAVNCARLAKPDRAAERISPEDAVDIARLASLRMWDAFSRLEKLEAGGIHG